MTALLARGIFERAESSQSFSTRKAGRVEVDFETIIESHENTWIIYVSKCYQDDIAQASSLRNDKLLRCAHLRPRCGAVFESAQKLRFHYEDVHCVAFNEGTKRRLFDTEIDIDSKADMEVDGPEMLQPMTPNKTEMKGTARQRAQYTFVHQTGTKTKATKASAATGKTTTSRRAKSQSIDVEDDIGKPR
jgi:hypothetical protein